MLPDLTCACCGHQSISFEHDICDICGWEHICQDELMEPDEAGHSPLSKAQEHYARHGVSHAGLERYWPHNREPVSRDPGWRVLRDYPRQDLALLYAAWHVRPAAVVGALDKGAQIEASFHHGSYAGQTALIWTASHLDLVRHLLNRGANPNACGRHHETALLVVTRGGCLDVIRELLAAGADPDLAAPHGISPRSTLDEPWVLQNIAASKRNSACDPRVVVEIIRDLFSKQGPVRLG
jgi:hypothetical protein